MPVRSVNVNAMRIQNREAPIRESMNERKMKQTMRMRSRTRGSALTVVLAAGLLSCDTRVPPQDVLANLSVRPAAEPFARLEGVLEDQDGNGFDIRARTEGRFSYVFFGFTHCPDVCPVAVAKTATALAAFTVPETPGVDVLFVSVDPERDSAERLKTWLGQFDSTFVGLRGSIPQVQKLLEQIGVSGLPLAEQTDAGHRVHAGPPHPTALYLFTPDNLGWLAYPWEGLDANRLRRDLERLHRVDWQVAGDQGQRWR